ncbi:GTP-binding protein Sar1 [Giardia muris]|uniref:GTP-binding protein Sar1 n=1 Tax=Giardia muris TaxID=5742 RepID=A0A4Z1SVG6_GIAMU|nr:GTP-binding protein Sar1 [Giardia muris]|eukprot:TNJ29786.1 GTP-binding protein Sar1 [Giardia muris]
MGFGDWFRNALAYLGLYRKKATIVFLGLDNAGKSTLLAMLKNASATTVAPTQHPTSQELVMGTVKFKTFDLGGHEVARQLWQSYVANSNGIVFLIDAADPTRFEESRVTLQALLNNKDLAKVPILILGNKVDIPTAVSTEQLIQAFQLQNLITGKSAPTLRADQRPLEVFPCSVVNRFGYADGFKWLTKYI